MKVEFFKHNIGKTEISLVTDVLNSIFITTGKVVQDFEAKLGAYLDGRSCIAVTSCTAALHLALVALGIKPGQEVITTPLTFVASASAILMAGGKPVFVDVEKETGNIDVAKIEQAITVKTFGIIPVHLYGQMVDMKALKVLADKHDLKIVEDCAHCIEGVRDEIKPGQLSDAACFSFYATKNITSAEGGAIVTANIELAAKLKKLRLHGMSASAEDRYTKHYKHYDIEMLGYKYNMANMNAALLLNQMDKIEVYLARREEICQRYNQGFSGNVKIKLPVILPKVKSARHLYTILVDPQERDRVLSDLQDAQIGVSVNFRPVHLMKYYKDMYGFSGGEYEIAEKFGAETISLPLYPLLTEEEIDYVIEKVNEIV